jgi:hypothetical protein
MISKSPTYDIFISYRRDGGYETALPIVEKLRSAGYRVFFDLESMNSGKFNEQLISVIDGAKLQEIAADFPTTDVNIGLLQLKD